MKAARQRNIFLSAISGNMLEYYDFTVYAVFSIEIGRAFFAADSEIVRTLFSLGVFAVGFITRPIGGICFGYLGDKYGRRLALIFSMLGMTFTTFAIGLIPDHHQIGILAPILLVIMRLIQGLCISGEGAGAAIFVLEHYGNLRAGLIAGIVQASNIMGTILASVVGMIINNYYGHIEEAWRFAFILGGIMGVFGFYIRLKSSETPIFKILAQKKSLLKEPFLSVVKHSWHYMFLTFSVAAIAGSVVYIVKTYVNVYYSTVMHIDKVISLLYLFYSSLILMLTMPVIGWLADIMGSARTMILGAILVMILFLPTMFLMSSEVWWVQLAALTLLGILAGSVSGATYVFVITLFDPEQRFTGVAFSYNLGIAMFGGTSPMICRWLVDKTALSYAPAFYIMVIALLFLLHMYIMRKAIAVRLAVI